MRFHTTQARAGLAALALLAAAAPAAAHHPLGGGTPATFADGLLSGVGHPMLGVDHFAFILAMGLAAAAAGRLFTAPLAFLAASALGVMLTFSGVGLPLVEVMVAGSAVLIGGVVLSGRALSAPLAAGLFAAAGLFHGHAYGAAIVGGETTPLVAYLIGLSLTQYAIAAGAGLLALRLWKAADAASVPLRIAGGVTAGVGAAFLVENVEALLFAAA